MAAQVSLALSYTVTVWRESKALVRTMSAVGANDAAHAHGRRALEQALGSQTVRLGDAREAARYRKDTVVDALDNLADAGAHTSLIAKVSDILASLAYDDAGFLGRDNGSERELRLGVSSSVRGITSPSPSMLRRSSWSLTRPASWPGWGSSVDMVV